MKKNIYLLQVLHGAIKDNITHMYKQTYDSKNFSSDSNFDIILQLRFLSQYFLLIYNVLYLISSGGFKAVDLMENEKKKKKKKKKTWAQISVLTENLPGVAREQNSLTHFRASSRDYHPCINFTLV